MVTYEDRPGAERKLWKDTRVLQSHRSKSQPLKGNESSAWPTPTLGGRKQLVSQGRRQRRKSLQRRLSTRMVQKRKAQGELCKSVVLNAPQKSKEMIPEKAPWMRRLEDDGHEKKKKAS